MTVDRPSFLLTDEAGEVPLMLRSPPDRKSFWTCWGRGSISEMDRCAAMGPAADSIAVATITWARSSADETLLVRSIGALAGLGYPTAIADRGNSPAFTRALKAIPGVRVVVPTARGLVAQVHASLSLSHDSFKRHHVLYTEPDKESFFRRGLTRFVEAALNCDASVVIASRSPQSFESYPAMQQYAEGVFNRLCGELLNAPGDYCYGPFLMSSTLAQTSMRLPIDLNWGWRPATFRTAQQSAGAIRHIVDDYPCPPEQRVEEIEERAYRIRQLSENLRGLIGDPVGA